jgi:hypothetical protein
MKRFSRRIIFCLMPATLAALAVGIPTASPDLGLRPVTVACSVDSPFTLSAEPAMVTQIGLALAAMTDPSCGITQTDPSATPAKTFAVGGGLAVDGTKFSFSAHLNTPDSPSGYAHVSGFFGGAFDMQGHVTCLTVSGNMANVGFKFEKGTAPPGVTGALFRAEDNGPPGGATPDRFRMSALTDSPPDMDHCFVASPPVLIPVIQGNIVVK